MKNLFSISLILAILVAASPVVPAQAQLGNQAAASSFILGGTTERVSIASDGTQANKDSANSSISADGRYVAFESAANDLVSGDTNGDVDIFVHDRSTSRTKRVSLSSSDAQANNGSGIPAISADGQFVAFVSAATNLVTGDTNGADDIFARDLSTGKTRRVSVDSDGTQGNGDSRAPTLSADGRLIAFGSDASDLVPGDTNDVQDIFVHNQVSEQTKRVSINSDGKQANNTSRHACISADGRYVVFESLASNLVSGDTNGNYDIFVHDRSSGQTKRVSIAGDGTQGNKSSFNPVISSDGRFVAFESNATNLVNGDTNGYPDIFVHDRLTGETQRVSVASDSSQGNDASKQPAISADGRYVAFASAASNLVTSDTNGRVDIFIHDRATGQTTRLSVASDGTQANLDSYEPSLSGTGVYGSFESNANNLVSGDTNDSADIFVRDLLGAPPYKIYLPIATK
jgi:Tol biopolymer transport system component